MLRFHSSRLSAFAACTLVSLKSASIALALNFAPLFRDEMVLQRDAKVPVWGTAQDGAPVVVTFAGQTKEVAVIAGRWEVVLDPMQASTDNRTLSAQQGEGVPVVRNDILVGDVWLAAGQSNMDMAFSGSSFFSTDGPDADFDNIRFCITPRTVSSPDPTKPPLPTLQWKSVSPTTAGSMTAVGYYFARDIYLSTGVPIGIIQCSYGGSRTEAWASPELMAKGWPDYNTFVANQLAADAEFFTRLPQTQSSVVYEYMLKQHFPAALKGVIWYQGEGNSAQAQEQKRLLPSLITEFRSKFRNETLPFYFVQLARLHEEDKVVDWSRFRLAQLEISKSTPHTFMAVIHDLPRDYNLVRNDPIHPTAKRPVGQRLARGALKYIYGQQNLVPSGPIYREAEVESDAIYLMFDHAETNLVARGDGELRGFEAVKFNGTREKIVPQIQNDRLIFRGSGTLPLSAIRKIVYAAKIDPDDPANEVNLVNGAGLPASPFETEWLRPDAIFAFGLSHRYYFKKDFKDSIGSLDGVGSTAGVFTEAPEFAHVVPISGQGKSSVIMLGKNLGVKKSAVIIDSAQTLGEKGTLRFWFKPSSSANGRYIVNAGLNNGFALVQNATKTSLNFAVVRADNPNPIVLSYTGADTDWHYFALTWDKVEGKGTVYLDDSQVDFVFSPANWSPVDLRFGQFVISNDANFLVNQYQGYLSDLQIFKQALSPTHVSILKNNPDTLLLKPNPYIVEAEDYDEGGAYNAYKMDEPGNQGNLPRRAHDVDMHYEEHDDTAVVYVATSAGQTADEWINYTITVPTSGWYQLSVRARSGVGSSRVVTVINERAMGESNWISTGGFRDNIVVVPRVYLGDGTHRIKFVFPLTGANSFHLDSFKLSPIPASAGIRYSVFKSNGEQFVASATVTDSPFNADKEGVNDSTQAFQNALNLVGDLGGGVVYAPAGRYLFNGNLVVPGNVTLMGDWQSPMAGGSGAGTILQPTAGAGLPDSTPFIRLGGRTPIDQNAAVRNLSIWYPNQSASSPIAYPFTISTFNRYQHVPAIKNITLYNSWAGVYVEASAHCIENIYGTVLNKGVVVGGNYEYSTLQNVNLNNNFWLGVASEFNGTLDLNAMEVALNDYTSEYLRGIQMGSNDGYQVYGVDIEPLSTLKGIFSEKLAADKWPVAGIFSKINAKVDFGGDAFRTSNLHTVQTDLIKEASALSYQFMSLPAPAKEGSGAFYNVRDYGAVGDGSADDTRAFELALDAAGIGGGGVVFVPQGAYKVTSNLIVPDGVELLGPYGARTMSGLKEACVILIYTGRNVLNPDNHPAFLSLGVNSGVRGFVFAYPEQGHGSSYHPVAVYPPLIKNRGAGAWVDACTIVNSWIGLDFSSAPASGFLIRDTAVYAFDTAIKLGGGTIGGNLERVRASWNVASGTYRQNAPFEYGLDALQEYSLDKTLAFYWGDCSDIKGINLNSYQINTHSRFLGGTAGQANGITLWHSSSDNSRDIGFHFQGGRQIQLNGVAGGVAAEGGTWLKTESSFTDTITINGARRWGAAGVHHIREGGLIIMNEEATLATGGTFTVSPESGTTASPANMLDRKYQTKWVATGTDKAGTVDLGQPSELSRWKLYNANINPAEAPGLNTKAARLLVSGDGVNFLPQDSFMNNTLSLLDRPMLDGNAVAVFPRARYVKVIVDQGEQVSSAGAARIAELFLYGRGGWHFRNGAEGWAVVPEHYSVMNYINERVYLATATDDPALASPMNINIDASVFKAVRVVMRAHTPSAANAQLFFRGNGQLFNAARSRVLPVVDDDGAFHVYDFDFADHPDWAGVISQIRFDPVNKANADLQIESIAFIKEAGFQPMPSAAALPFEFSVSANVGVSAFAQWAGGLAFSTDLLEKYAVGGAQGALDRSEPPVMQSGDGYLSLIAIVRVDDPNLIVFGEATPDLALPFSMEGVLSTTVDVNQDGVPPGTERRIYRVPMANQEKMFLRLGIRLESSP